MRVTSVLGKMVSVAQHGGVIELARKVWRRFFPPRLREFRLHTHRFANRIGLEIGGPSQIFSKRGLVPIYPIAKCIDNNNFNSVTIWDTSEAGRDGFTYDPKRKPGRQYIHEATALTAVASESYDFVLSSHVIEHVANPIKALKEWVRILRPSGALLLVVPHKDGTFDHRRPTTTLAHLVDDFNKNMGEDDMTHLPEILSLHDLSLDPAAGTTEEFRSRSLNNAINRCLHHHTFNSRLVAEMVDFAGLQIHFVSATLPMHIVLLAEKLPTPVKSDNSPFLADLPVYATSSPFRSDWVSCNLSDTNSTALQSIFKTQSK